MQIENIIKSQSDIRDIYNSVSRWAMDCLKQDWEKTDGAKAVQRRAYYLSAEFLTGRLVQSNLLNLGILDEVRQGFDKAGTDFNVLEEVSDCALGNGGLGRLAACFLDSAAALGINLDGYGIRYKYGLFKQGFENGFQTEACDDWTAFGDPWSKRVDSDKIRIVFGDETVCAVPYDMPVIGYGNKKINALRLWQSEAIEPFDFGKFNSGKYDAAVKAKNSAERLSSILYPNDNTKAGKILRLKQEYFLCSASMQDILKRYEQTGQKLSEIHNKIAVQLNDTHPVFSIPEFIRLLVERGIGFNTAAEIAQKVFSYTNHTVMAEALEKWSMKTVKAILPEIYKIITALSKMQSGKNFPAYHNIALVRDGNVCMADLGVFLSNSVNGVAEIHTGILKAETLKDWYNIYPDKFINVTNGVTQRRWLKLCNPQLSDFISERIGEEWITNLGQLKKLESYCSEPDLKKFAAIKYQKKTELSKYIEKRENIVVSPNFIFDIQIKRLHEYKRQLLNALSILDFYYKIKEGRIKFFKPTAFIFGAKAAPGYFRAKAIIKFINSIADKINNDNEINKLMKVVFVTDYNVSYAEKLISAADISQQISCAGTEASGTGNMKLMLNGAVTLGTYDGANIEIAAAAGSENNYIFGARVEEINAVKSAYNPLEIYNGNPDIKRVVDSLIDGTFNDGGSGMFKELYTSLLNGASWHKADHYFVLYDFEEYQKARLKANADYGSSEFTKKCFFNTANAGNFSSDRSIKEYAQKIWKL